MKGSACTVHGTLVRQEHDPFVLRNRYISGINSSFLVLMLVRHISALQHVTGQGFRPNTRLLRSRLSKGTPASTAFNQPSPLSPDMEEDVEQLVRRIHRSQSKVAVVVTGGGSQVPAA